MSINNPAIVERMNLFPRVRKRVIGILLLLCLLAACGAPKQYELNNERDFQQAFNQVYFKGKAKMEVPVKYGRVDLLTGDFAIEVDNVDKFHEAIGQALHYAKETGRKPAVAFFVLEINPVDRKKLKYATKLCEHYGIKVWFINDELEKDGKYH